MQEISPKVSIKYLGNNHIDGVRTWWDQFRYGAVGIGLFTCTLLQIQQHKVSAEEFTVSGLSLDQSKCCLPCQA